MPGRGEQGGRLEQDWQQQGCVVREGRKVINTDQRKASTCFEPWVPLEDAGAGVIMG